MKPIPEIALTWDPPTVEEFIAECRAIVDRPVIDPRNLRAGVALHVYKAGCKVIPYRILSAVAFRFGSGVTLDLAVFYAN